MSITLEQFFKGRDKQFPSELTATIKANAAETLRRANIVLAKYEAANPVCTKGRGCNSGWRPAAVNAGTAGASPTSKHMTGQAIDIGDDDESLDKWLITPAGLKVLEEVGMWLESPKSTPRWCHLQTVAPRSGNRIFLP
jgi:hypothetical protein